MIIGTAQGHIVRRHLPYVCYMLLSSGFAKWSGAETQLLELLVCYTAPPSPHQAFPSVG